MKFTKKPALPPDQLDEIDGAMGLHPSKRSMPIEASDDKATRRSSDVAYGVSVNQLWLWYYHENYRADTFGIVTSDQEVRDFLGRMLHVAVSALQDEDATAAGLAFRLIWTASDYHPTYRKHTEGPQLLYSRSSRDVREEIALVTKTLARLQEELAVALEAEGML